MPRSLTAEDLLAGAGATFAVQVPARVLDPDAEEAQGGEVTLRPLTVRDLQRITQAAKEQQILTSILMVQQALVDPKLSVDQTASLPAGLLQFLLQKVNSISGLSLESEEIEASIRAPLSRACFLLAREFGWTPEQCSALTVGQVLMYLEMMARGNSAEGV